MRQKSPSERKNSRQWEFHSLPTREILREIFDYDHERGCLIWKPRPRSHFRSDRAMAVCNGTFAGRVAGHQSARGYWVLMLDGKRYGAHRLIWAWHHGDLPAGQVVDHIDGDPSNNKIENIRAGSYSLNSRNQKLSRRNTSGMPGVRRTSNGKAWLAMVGLNREYHYLGIYKQFDDAARVVADFRAAHGFTERHGRAA